MSLALFTADFATIDNDFIKAIEEHAAIEGRKVVVFVHWGSEYFPVANENQREAAKTWIDAGADAVIGTGAHVIQDAEVYDEKPIIYSLGNFLFDQEEPAETMTGLIVSGEFTDDGLTLYPKLINQDLFQPVLQRSAEADREIMRYLDAFEPYKVDSLGGLKLQFNHKQ